MTLAPRGNAHVSKGKIRKNLERLKEARIRGLEVIQQQQIAKRKASLNDRLGAFLFDQRYKRGSVTDSNGTTFYGYKSFLGNIMPLSVFLATIRDDEVVLAEEAGIYDLPSQESLRGYFSENEIPGELVENISVENRFHNHCKGHKLDKGSKNRRPRITKGGNGFIYESRIPSRPQIDKRPSYIQRRHPDLSLSESQTIPNRSYNTTAEAKEFRAKSALVEEYFLEHSHESFENNVAGLKKRDE